MSRLLMILAVAALMAAMTASAGPAVAQDSFGNESYFNNDLNVVQYNDEFYVYDDSWDDCYFDEAWGYDEVGTLDDCYWWYDEY